MRTNALTVKDFFKRFPDDDACLAHIMDVRYGMRHVCTRCGENSTFHRLANRKAYACSKCGDNLYPCAGTIFQDSRTSLQTWFYAIYLFITTRHGVSGKELQRSLGVTYKTAWRMGQQIRSLMEKANGELLLSGHVEVDEAYVGGKHSGGKRGRGAAGKTIVMGLKERNGRMVAKVVDDVKTETLQKVVQDTVVKGSTVSTDEHTSYRNLQSEGYKHGAVKHGQQEYAYYDYRHGVTHHTNSVDNFWRLLKASIRSTHVHVSERYMKRYLGEFVFRANNARVGNAMFDLLVGAV